MMLSLLVFCCIFAQDPAEEMRLCLMCCFDLSRGMSALTAIALFAAAFGDFHKV